MAMLNLTLTIKMEGFIGFCAKPKKPMPWLCHGYAYGYAMAMPAMAMAMAMPMT